MLDLLFILFSMRHKPTQSSISDVVLNESEHSMHILQSLQIRCLLTAALCETLDGAKEILVAEGDIGAGSGVRFKLVEGGQR